MTKFEIIINNKKLHDDASGTHHPNSSGDGGYYYIEDDDEQFDNKKRLNSEISSETNGSDGRHTKRVKVDNESLIDQNQLLDTSVDGFPMMHTTALGFGTEDDYTQYFNDKD